jgi:hypothetical protein
MIRREQGELRLRPTDMRKTPIYFLMLLALVSCAPSAEGRGPSSGVVGKVLLGPQCREPLPRQAGGGRGPSLHREFRRGADQH